MIHPARFLLQLSGSSLGCEDASLLRQLVWKESRPGTVWQRAAAQGQSRCGFALLHMSILGQVDADLFMFFFFFFPLSLYTIWEENNLFVFVAYSAKC